MRSIISGVVVVAVAVAGFVFVLAVAVFVAVAVLFAATPGFGVQSRSFDASIPADIGGTSSNRTVGLQGLKYVRAAALLEIIVSKAVYDLSPSLDGFPVFTYFVFNLCEYLSLVLELDPPAPIVPNQKSTTAVLDFAHEFPYQSFSSHSGNISALGFLFAVFHLDQAAEYCVSGVTRESSPLSKYDVVDQWAF